MQAVMPISADPNCLDTSTARRILLSGAASSTSTWTMTDANDTMTASIGAMD
jgi:hypothetical protein